jgi:hypothetical protein
MVARLLAALAVAALAAGCQEESEPVAFSCSDDPQAIVKALDAAPGAVKLSDGASISACLRDADSTADLQNVGVSLSTAAEELEAPALKGDADAGLKLGYLIGAARKGAETNSGLASELVRRLEGTVGFEVTPEVDAAIERGLAAGAKSG